MLVPGIDDPRKRLRLGQGFAGGKAALPALGAPTLTPRPPVGVPRIHPQTPAASLTAGPPAIDVTPPHLGGGPLAPAGQGAAVLRRGSPFTGLINVDKPLGAGEKKTLKLLKNPDRLYKPENAQNLRLILKPSAKVQAMIDTDPHLKQNQQALQQHILTNGPVKLPAQDLIKKLHNTVGQGKMNIGDFVAQNRDELMALDDTAKQRFSSAADVAQYNAANVNVAAGKLHEAGVQAPIQRVFDEGGILGRAFDQAFSTVTGMVPGTYKLITDPQDTIPAMAKATAHYYGPLFHGDVGKFAENVNQQPLTPLLDASALVSAGAGTAGRLGAVGDASAAARAAATVESLPSKAAAGLAQERSLWQQRLEQADQMEAAARQTHDPVRDAGHFAGINTQRAQARANIARIDKAIASDKGSGAALVGGRYGIHPMKNGRYMIRDQQTNRLVTNMPDAESAVAHAKALGEGATDKSIFRTALHAFTHPEMYGKARGSLLDQYEKRSSAAQTRIDAENKNIIEQLQEVADNPNLKLSRRSRKEVIAAAKADVHATMSDLRNRPTDILSAEPEFMNRATANVRAGAVQGYRELLGAVRLGAIYLRPAYLPNNWAGNTFMSLTHQGFLAPVNLAKSVVMHNHLEPRNLAMIDKSLGQHAAAAAYEGIPRGFVSSAGHPLVDVMGKLADQPFRRAAWLQEARRVGYNKLSDVDSLLNRFRSGDERAQTEVANIARRAQEEVVKFGHMGEKEKALANNLFFVYNWVKGSTRYAARFPLHHPIQTDLYAHDQQGGHDWVNSQMGGVPWFLAGSIPVGRKANGDPILINPFALNPLGTSIDVARAAAGSYKALRHPKQFNKYSDATAVDLMNPLVQMAAKHFLGGDTASTQYELSQSIAPWRLAQDLAHPGRGSMFPMTRPEALGHFIFGALYPRRASQDAISRALSRQNQNNPVALLDQQVKDYEKTTGHTVDPRIISGVKGDLDQLQMIKDFQTKYAASKGSQGFKNMPPANKGEAAIQYLQQNGHLPKDVLDTYAKALQNAPNDSVANELANALWGMTNAGQFKRHWDELRNSAAGTKKLTPKRK